MKQHDKTITITEEQQDAKQTRFKEVHRYTVDTRKSAETEHNFF